MVLTELCDQSPGMKLEGIYQQLASLSTLKLDDDYIFENEDCAADLSPYCKTVTELSSHVEELMAEISKVVTINSYRRRNSKEI